MNDNGPPLWKMRYAPHIGLTAPDAPLFLHSVGTSDPIEQIRYIAALGFAGIEDNSLKLRPVAMQERMGSELAGLGLEMGCFVNNPMVWNKPVWGSRSDDARTLLDSDLAESIAASKRVGGRYVTVVSGRDPATPRAYQLANMVENLKRLAEPALKAGLVMAVETVNARGWPNMLLHHIDEAYAVVKAVASPSVKLLFDVGHVHPMDGDIIANLKATWDEIAVIQAADIPGRLELGSGEINWVNVLRVIRQLGYTGLIELEHVISRPGAAGEQGVLDNLRAIDEAI